MDPYPIHRTTSARIPTPDGTFHLTHYVDEHDGKEHLALSMGDVDGQTSVLVRVHSECFTGDVLGSQRCDCGEQLHQAMARIAQLGRGVIIYLRQEGRGIGLSQKLRAYNLQDQGYDTVDANLMLGHQADERSYGAAAAILADLGITSIRLMTNNPTKIDHLVALGVQIDERVPLHVTVTQHNALYLAAKVERMHHLLSLPEQTKYAAAQEVTPGLQDRLAALQQRAETHHARTGRPFVTLSYAQSLNGTIGGAAKTPLAISGPESLRITHMLRSIHDGILVGIGTVLADDPRLSVRLIEGPSPRPIIVDSRGRTPRDARLWQHSKSPWIATGLEQTQEITALAERGAHIFPTPQHNNRLDLAHLFDHLGANGLRSVMVEGGAAIISNLLAYALVDYAIITIAPRFLRGTAVLDNTLDNTGDPAQTEPALANTHYTPCGEDLLVWGDVIYPGVHTNGRLSAVQVESIAL